MQCSNLRITDGSVAGAWILPRLSEEFAAVTFFVPKGYEAYARIFHPALDLNGNRARWSEVAAAFGKIAHREMQWHALLGLSDPAKLGGSYGRESAIGSRWAGQDPSTGEMDRSELDVLCKILAAHTGDPGDCYFGLSTLQNWLGSFASSELTPVLKHPWSRDYVVLAGHISAVDQLIRDWAPPTQSGGIFAARLRDEAFPDPSRLDWKRREAPNLIWPADRAWLVASDVDLDSTLVGGSAHLIKAIVESSELEAWEVEPSDSLAADADKINC